jgi:zinc/manganese transport system substrate-binding protein
MISKKRILLFGAFFSLSATANSPIKVLVTLPDFIEMVKEIGGMRVEVDSFLDGSEDPHFVDAVPSFIAKASKADVVCAVGLELEIGWLPKVLSKSGNAKVQQGGKGFCELGRNVNVLEKLTGPADRSMGDVHGAGNPHYNLSPTKLIEASSELLRVLKKNDPSGAALFETNAKIFAEKMTTLKHDIATRLEPLKGKPLIQFHKHFVYFFEEYGLSTVGAIEEKPGVPPSSARLVQVSNYAKTQNVVLAIGELNSPTKHLAKFSEISGIPYIKIPAIVQKQNPNLDRIAELQAYLASELLKAAKL